MHENEEIYNIIVKQLQDEADASELRLVEDWRKQSTDNETTYQSFKNAWRATDVSTISEKYNAEGAWEKIDARIQKQPAKVFSINKTRFAVAASFIALAVIASVIFFSGKNSLVTETAFAENKKIALPDGSTIFLRKGSTAEWNSDFSERNVSLKGEALFDVQHDAKHPFSVKNIHTTVTVLGTSFNINTNTNTDVVTVIRGKVAVAAGDEKQVLITGESVSATEHLNTKTAAELNVVAWQTGVLNFTETPLKKVLADVSAFYNKPLTIQPTSLADKFNVTLRFEKQPIKEVVNEIALVTGLSVKNAGDTMILYRK